MRARTLAVSLVALAATGGTAIPALAAGRAHGAGTHTVVLQNIKFHPGSLSIKKGDTIKWEWRDKGIEHNVTGKAFKSHTMAKGSYSVRFTHTGSFSYRCTIHAAEGMTGKIVVH
jgi:plastocyanin